MVNGYEACNCGGEDAYKSYAGYMCCSQCFKPLKTKTAEARDNVARVFRDDDGWAVKVGGVTKRYFSKHEDYAATDAEKFARKYNNDKLTGARNG